LVPFPSTCFKIFSLFYWVYWSKHLWNRIDAALLNLASISVRLVLFRRRISFQPRAFASWTMLYLADL
jgi:hypothetical protein